MATNIKAKKKKGSYDNKLIKWIAIGLAALVAIIVAAIIIVNVSGSYVAKAGTEKIYTFEFEYFLSQAIYEEYNAEFDNFDGKPEDYDSLSDEEKNEIIDKFFDDARQEKIKAAALEKARVFKAEYALAVKNGYKLTSQQKTTVKANVDSYYNYYRNMGLTDDQAKYYLTGGTGMTLSEYKKWVIEQSAIESYKAALKEGYNVTADDIQKKYDEDPDDYRTLSARVFKFDLPTMPKDENGNAVKPDSENTADKTAYEDHMTKLENYVKVAEQMKAAFDAGEKYTLYDYDYATLTPKKETDDEGKETDKDKIVAENATFEELCTSVSKWTSASSNKGVVSINHSSSSGVEKIDEFVLRVQWNNDRTGFVVTAAPAEDGNNTETDSAGSSSTDGSDTVTTGETTGEAAAKVKPSDIEIIKVTDADGVLTELYLVRVEDITDIGTAPEEGQELNSIQSSIKSTLLEEQAVAELEEKVAAAGNKYALRKVKDKLISKIMKEQF